MQQEKKRFEAEFERCLALLFPSQPQRHYFSKYKKYFNRSQNIYYLIIFVQSYAPALLFPCTLYPRLHAGSTCLRIALPSILTYVQCL